MILVILPADEPDYVMYIIGIGRRERNVVHGEFPDELLIGVKVDPVVGIGDSRSREITLSGARREKDHGLCRIRSVFAARQEVRRVMREYQKIAFLGCAAVLGISVKTDPVFMSVAVS